MIFNLIAGSGSAVWTPAELFKNGEEGFWLDGSDPTNMWKESTKTTQVTASGDPIGYWKNKVTGWSETANLHDLSTVTAAYRPAYDVTSGIGSIYYDGTDDRSAFYDSDTTITTPNGMTFIIGFKFPTASDYKIIINTGDIDKDLLLETRYDNKVGLFIDNKYVTSTNNYSTTSYNIAMGYAKDTTDPVTLVLNDTTVIGSLAPTSSRIPLQNKVVPPDYTNTIYFSQFILIDRLLTATEKTELTNFVKAKSGL